MAAQRPGALPALQALQTRAGRLSFIRSGAGAPTLLLFNGAGLPLDAWAPLYPRIEALGTVLAWNRFGLPGSDGPPAQQTGAAVLASLRELLRCAGAAPPYVLVAHSLGGLHANLYARLHPREVAGVLFLEAAHPDDQALLRRHEHAFVRSLGKVTGLPQALFEPNVQAELQGLDATVQAIAAADAFPPVPVRVLSAGRTPPGALLSPAAVAARRANQQALARLSPRGAQVIARHSGHFPQWSEPELVLQVLRELVAAVGAAPARAST